LLVINLPMLLLLGLATGLLSGLIGIGGGVFIVPALVFLFGLSQKQAEGTTLAVMVPPIGLLAAWEYYRSGFVDIKVAGLICIGFFFGGFFGAKLATEIATATLQKVFGVAIVAIGLKMIFA
jgi:uncharacterized membrane protein YfcA